MKGDSTMAKVQGPGILNQWSCHIPGNAQNLEKFYQYVGEEFAKKQIANMAPYWDKVGSTFGTKKNFWAVDYGNSTCYIGAETLGIDLYVSWLVYNPKWQKEQMKAQSLTRATLWSMFGSDIGDMLELACFAVVIKDCAVTASERLMDEGNLDKSRMNRQSSGALGPI